MKPAQITAKEYIWEQLDKHIVTEPLEDILKQIETQNGTHMVDTQQESMTTDHREDNSQMNRRVNSGQRTVQIACHIIEMLRGLARKVTLTPEPGTEE